MRPIARQSIRLARSSAARRQSLLKRQPHRPFHAYAPCLSTSRPPTDNNDQNTSLNDSRESQRRVDNATPSTDQLAEQESGESKSNGEAIKSGFRRTPRQRRANDVPKPPPVPEWFLKQNVELLRETTRGRIVKTENRYQMQCIDEETGHVLFVIPYFESRPKRENMAQKKGENVKAVARKQGDPDKSAEPPEQSDVEEARSAGRSKPRLDEGFFNQQKPADLMKPKAQAEKNPAIATPNEGGDLDTSQFDAPGFGEVRDPLMWSFLEAETSARAAFALAESDQHASSFMADRVDLSLVCEDSNAHGGMDVFVGDLAQNLQADVVSLDANDFADLTDDYVGQSRDEPGSFSTLGYDVFEGYTANSLRNKSDSLRPSAHEFENEDMEEDEEEEEYGANDASGMGSSPFMSIEDIQKALRGGQFSGAGRIVGVGVEMPQPAGGRTAGTRSSRSGYRPSQSDLNRDEARLGALMDHILDAPDIKRAGGIPASPSPGHSQTSDHPSRTYLEEARADVAKWLSAVSDSTARSLLLTRKPQDTGKVPFDLSVEPMPEFDYDEMSTKGSRRTVVHVRDLQDIKNTRLGELIIDRLVKAVQKRRRSGEHIVVVGTTAHDVSSGPPLSNTHDDYAPLRTIKIPPLHTMSQEFLEKHQAIVDQTWTGPPMEGLSEPAYKRILEINLRHLSSALYKLRPDHPFALMDSLQARKNMSSPGSHFLSERVLPLDEVQRLALLALGLTRVHARSVAISPAHIGLAAFFASRSDHILQWASTFRSKVAAEASKKTQSNNEDAKGGDGKGKKNDGRIEQLKKDCNAHESRLLSGVVDPQNIKISFNDVHAAADTTTALKTLTTLSLLRPEAFSYGVLAKDRLPGLLLYGPPGTGKTLLAKAVAKESKATVLEVSGAQIYEKYVGEGEKMVRAVFSLAKKLSPCIVFIDEADAIFGNRGNSGSRNSHREIINQFLREWDGMDDHSVFMMVASNRPFDLDDAVLRRLPRRLLIDLPVAKDRESILNIHLQGETLETSVSLPNLAERTPFYSGSDLKNVAVAAALAAVRDENDLAAANKDDSEFKLPERRTLTPKHFDQALAEISASISEDMSSLTAIRKFDEQFGDRRGRKKKPSYGFGTAEDENKVDENAVRVRQAPSPSPSPPSQ